MSSICKLVRRLHFQIIGFKFFADIFVCYFRVCSECNFKSFVVRWIELSQIYIVVCLFYGFIVCLFVATNVPVYLPNTLEWASTDLKLYKVSVLCLWLQKIRFLFSVLTMRTYLSKDYHRDINLFPQLNLSF